MLPRHLCYQVQVSKILIFQLIQFHQSLLSQWSGSDGHSGQNSWKLKAIFKISGWISKAMKLSHIRFKSTHKKPPDPQQAISPSNPQAREMTNLWRWRRTSRDNVDELVVDLNRDEEQSRNDKLPATIEEGWRPCSNQRGGTATLQLQQPIRKDEWMMT